MWGDSLCHSFIEPPCTNITRAVSLRPLEIRSVRQSVCAERGRRADIFGVMRETRERRVRRPLTASYYNNADKSGAQRAILMANLKGTQEAEGPVEPQRFQNQVIRQLQS